MTRAEQQLKELYIPLMVMQQRGKQAFHLFLSKVLGRGYVFDVTRKLSHPDLIRWVRWAEYAFIPMNEQIAQLLTEKHELIGDPTPRSFTDFLRYHEAFKAEHERWVRHGGDYNHPGNFPAGFDRDVEERVGLLSLEVEWASPLKLLT